MKKEIRKNSTHQLELERDVSAMITGGRLWPLIDFRDIFNSMILGEDIFLSNFYQIEKQ